MGKEVNGLSLDSDVLQPLVPFRHLMPSHLQQLIKECELLYLFPGDLLFEKGQYDDVHYYLLTGELQADGAEQKRYLESSLYPVSDQQPRAERVWAATEATLLKISRERLDQLLTWSQAAEYLLVDMAAHRHLDEDAAWLNTILKSNLFLKVPPTNVDKILSSLETRLVEAGEVIIRQGELGDCCYFIKEGKADVSRRRPDEESSDLVATIIDGRCFGEDALLTESVRNATVTMRTNGVLLELKKNDFLLLLREPESKTLSWSAFQEKAQSTAVIDVRTESEYFHGHLKNAVNIPLNLLRLKGRVLDPKQSYLLYCDSGNRSVTAAYFLSQHGITAQSLKGGISAQESCLKSGCWTTQDYVFRNGSVIEGH